MSTYNYLQGQQCQMASKVSKLPFLFQLLSLILSCQKLNLLVNAFTFTLGRLDGKSAGGEAAFSRMELEARFWVDVEEVEVFAIVRVV
jgi:hypothetical protein